LRFAGSRRDRGVGAFALACRARATMVIRLGKPRVRGVVRSNLLEVEVPLVDAQERREDLS